MNLITLIHDGPSDAGQGFDGLVRLPINQATDDAPLTGARAIADTTPRDDVTTHFEFWTVWTGPRQSFTEIPSSSSEGPSAELSYYRDQLQRLAALPAGWDGYHARPIAKEAVARSYRMLVSLSRRAASEPPGFIRLPDIVPTGDGSVHLEWEDSIGSLFVDVPAYDEPVSYYGHLGAREVMADEASTEDVWRAMGIVCSR